MQEFRASVFSLSYSYPKSRNSGQFFSVFFRGDQRTISGGSQRKLSRSVRQKCKVQSALNFYHPYLMGAIKSLFLRTVFVFTLLHAGLRVLRTGDRDSEKIFVGSSSLYVLVT